MTPRDFVYWLQGYIEISGATELNEQAVREIKNHLALVLTKETPTPTAPWPPVDPYAPYRTTPTVDPDPWGTGIEITCNPGELTEGFPTPLNDVVLYHMDDDRPPVSC